MEIQENKKYTVKEVVNLAIDTLNGINVPIGLSQQIAVPICNAVGYLQQCVEVFNREEMEQQIREQMEQQVVTKVPEAEATEVINGEQDGSATNEPAQQDGTEGE